MNILLNIISLKFRILPRSVALFIGRLLGLFIYYCVPIRKHIAIQNIKIAFPEYSPSEVKLLLKNTCKHYGMVLIDFLRQPHLDDQNISNFVRIDEKSNMSKLSDQIIPQLNTMQKNFLGLLFFNELSQNIVEDIVAQQLSMMPGKKLASVINNQEQQV